MDTVDYQNLQAIVNASDIAIRVASQLRQWEGSHVTSDRDAIDQAVQFLDRASNGGSFMAGQLAASAKFGDTLQPLNWATDAYFAVSPNTVTSESPDYAKIARYLEQLTGLLKSVITSGKVDPPRLREAVTFFSTLGELLGSRADQKMRRESFRADLGIGV